MIDQIDCDYLHQGVFTFEINAPESAHSLYLCVRDL